MAVSKELQILLTAKNKAEKELKKAQKTLDGINNELKKVGKNSKELDKLKKPTNGLIKEVTQLATSFFAITTAIRFFKDATTNFLEFEKEMKRVNTITRLNADEFKQMSKEVENLSTIVPFTAQTLSTGLFDVASAGVSAGNQMAFLGQAAKFAAAGGMQDVSVAVQGLTGVIKGFNLVESDAVKVSDLFFKTNELGQTTVQELAISMQQVTSTAKESGVRLEELFAVYATLTGVTGDANIVTTQFKGILTAIIKPADEAKKEAERLGIEFSTAALKAKGLAGILKDVREKTGGNIDSLGKLFGNVRALTGELVLGGIQLETFEEKLKELENSTGATEIAFKEMMTSQQNQLKLASNEWDFFKKRVGKVTSYLMIRATELANSIYSAFRFIGKVMLLNAEQTGKVFISLSEIIVGFVKDSINAFKSFINIIKDVSNVMGKLPTFFGAVLKDIGISFKETFKNIIDKIPGLSGAIVSIKGSLNTLREGFKNNVETVRGWLNSIGNFLTRSKNTFKRYTKAVSNALAGKFEDIKNLVIGKLDDINNEVKEPISKVKDEMKKEFNEAKKESESIFSGISDFISDTFVISTENTKKASEEIGTAIKNIGKDTNFSFNNTKEAINNSKERLSGYTDKVKTLVIELFNASKESKEFAKFKQKEAEQLKILKEIVDAESEATKLSTKEKEKAKKEAEKLVKANEKLTDTFNDLQKNGSESLKELAYEHEKSMRSIQNNIVKTETQLSNLESAFKKAQIASEKGFEEQRQKDIQSVAELIVSEEEKAAKIREQIAKESNKERRQELQKELNEIVKSLEDNAVFINQIENQINEARRIASLDNISRAVEEFKKKRLLAQQEFDTNRMMAQAEFNAKKKELENELSILNNKLEQEKILFTKKEEFITKQLKLANKIRQEQKQNTFNNTEKIINKEIKLYEKLANAIKKAQSAKTPSFIPSASITPFANGGIVNKPTLGLVGEAGPEAVVPLNKGLTGVGGMVINITGTFLDEDSGEKVGNMIIRKLKENARL